MKKTLLIFTLTVLVLSGCASSQMPEEEMAAMETAETITMDNWKTYEGDGFTFKYPDTYVADEMGLWTEDGYENHINPPENCSVCQIPYIAVVTVKSPLSLDEFIIGKHRLPGNTLAEAEEISGVSFYDTVQVGDYEFTKILEKDMHEVTTYYTRNDFTIVGFQTIMDNVDLAEELAIMKTLEF